MARQWCRAMLLAVLMPPIIMAACPFSATWRGSGDAGPHGAAPDGLTATGDLAAPLSRHLLEKVDVKAVEALDVAAVKADLTKLLTDSQPQWPVDATGSYGGLFIRLAWHCNGSYRKWDGRGGCNGARQRFMPELAWPDNANLDKARKLLEPIKAKYGAALSWGDLIVLAGDTSIEAQGGPKIPFCLGRVDDKDGTASLELGPTPQQRLVAPCTAGDGNCENPLGQTTMGLIYVNPEGVMGVPDPTPSVEHIRRTFEQMGMNDSETVALIGGGHAFGMTHGACATGPGPGPEEDPKNPWPGTCGSGADKGKGKNTFTSGFEGPWTSRPTKWDNEYFTNLLDFDWVKHKGPGDHWQWKALLKGSNDSAGDIMMLTADVALTKDPAYLALVKKYAADLPALTKDFGAAWYKLMTRDMGPHTRCLGKLAGPPQPWQMPLPPAPKTLPDFAKIKAEVLQAMVTPSAQLPPDSVGGKPTYAAVFADLAWKCAGTYRETDYQGGCNGAHIRFKPQTTWPGYQGVDKAVKVLQPVKAKHPNLSWADLIVLAGTAAAEAAAGPAAPPGAFAFCGGRTDAKSAAGTEALAPRNYSTPVIAFKDNAKVAGLTLPEAVALAAAPRSAGQQKRRGYSGAWGGGAAQLSNGYFKTLMGSEWAKAKSAGGKEEYAAKGKNDVFMMPSDLAIRNDAELSAIAKGYAADNSKFVKAFAAAWTKMMNADRFKGPVGSAC
ncbi:MAG: putative catalase-peroxidase [Monoraphidium minutum]|nr:MAG: putative catalase-peroxidase [Monoraphidium minutum]